MGNNTACTETVGAVSENGNSAKPFLNLRCEISQRRAIRLFWPEQRRLLFYYLIHSVIIRHNPPKVNDYDCFRMLVNRRFQDTIIHLRHMGSLISILLYIYKPDRRPAVDSCGGGCRVCIGWYNHLVTRTDTKYS